MVRKFSCIILLICISFAAASFANAADLSLESLKTPRGVTQKFILMVPDKPVAAVILFAGGHGVLGLKSATEMRWGSNNFLVRSRDKFADRGFLVAVVDAPSDQKKRMNVKFRMSKDHASDIEAVATYLKRKYNLPVWLVGTSRGTLSAANAAIGADNIDGLVLTATITKANPDWDVASSHPDGVASMAVDEISVPTLIMSHEDDECPVTPPSGVAMLKRKLANASRSQVILLEGGPEPEGEACEGQSEHGFYGIETEAVDEIADFIKADLP